MAWDDARRAQAVQMYLDAEPTPQNSMEIVNEIAQEMGESPNGVRMIIDKAGKYVKKDPKTAAPAGKAAASGDKTPRVSKEAAHAALTDAIVAAGGEADSEIISKLTGKAAQYFTAVVNAAAGNTDED